MKQKRILVVDDEPSILKSLQRVLLDRYEVVTALGGTDAIELLSQQASPFDIIISDMNMPDVNGVDLYRHVASIYPGYEKKIIFMTGGSCLPDLEEFMDDNNNSYLEKPFDPNVLLRLIEEMLDENKNQKQKMMVNPRVASIIQAEKISTLGQLAAGIAHEINNPLSCSMSNISILQRQLLSVKKLINMYDELSGDVIATNDINLQRQISEISTFSKDKRIPVILSDLDNLMTESLDCLEQIKLITSSLRELAGASIERQEPADINTILDKAISSAKSMNSTKVSIKKCFSTLPEIYCYPNKLNIAFINLLIHAEKSLTDPGEINVTSSSNQKNIQIHVSDNGRGISPENIQNIFVPFLNSKPAGGIGLAVVQQVVELHNGTVTVDSEVGKGSTFTVTLPIKA